MPLRSVMNAANSPKFSDVYLRFVEPLMNQLLQQVDTLPKGDVMETMLRIPWLAWNMEVMSTHNPDMDYMASFRFQTKNDPHGIALINEYRKRKRTLFKDYDVLLGDVTFTPTQNGDYHIAVKGHEPPTG